MNIDNDRVTAAVIGTGCGPVALEAGAELVQHWIDAGVCAEKKIVAVECGFVCWLDDRTVIIGVQDLLTDEDGVVGNEWKTTKEAGRYWDEGKWFDEISEGSQLGIYALALHDGTYYEWGSGRVIEPHVERPRIRVRAISKSAPPVIWPLEEDGMVEFSIERLKALRDALIVKAASIRAMRATGLVPWQLTGIWCVNKFRRECEHFGECSSGQYPSSWGVFDQNDPAFTMALPWLGERANDPEVVVLGASAYSAYSECSENGRRNTLGGGKEESIALDTGSCFHAGVAEFYRQVKEDQCNERLVLPLSLPQSSVSSSR